MKKIKGSIIWALLLLFVIPISSNAQSSPSPSPGGQTNPPKSLSEVILSNAPGILTGVAGILTGVAGIITAVYSRGKSKEEINKKVSLEEITDAIKTRDEFRHKLLDALVSNKPQVQGLTGFITSGEVCTQFKECQTHFDERLTNALKSQDMKEFIKTQSFITNEELKELRKHIENFDIQQNWSQGYPNFAHTMHSALFQTEPGKNLLMGILTEVNRPKYQNPAVLEEVTTATHALRNSNN